MSYFILYYYLFVCCSGSFTSFGEERANHSAIAYLQLCFVLFRGVSSWCLG